MVKIKTILKVILITLLGLSLFIGYMIYTLFYDMSHLPEGNFIESYESPSGDYTLNIYISSPALSSSAIRGEIVYNNKNFKKKNIYWQYKIDDASVLWVGVDTVLINGVKLNVLKDTYDYRRNKYK